MGEIRNNNKGTVQYGVGYKGTNITVKAYADSESPSTGTMTESESKFIKLYIENIDKRVSALEEFKNKVLGMVILIGCIIGCAIDFIRERIM